MKKILLTCCLLAVVLHSLLAQSPYQLKTGREIGLYSLGIGLMGGGYYMRQQMDPLSTAEVSGLNARSLTKLERWATQMRSGESNKASDMLLFSSNIMPFVLTLSDKAMRKDCKTIGAMYGQAVFINLGLTALAKTTVQRTRPYAYQSKLAVEERATLSAKQSFWSGHTSQAAAMCFLSARLFSDYHPDSKWKPVIWTAAATIPAATGILRMTAGKHFPTDVLFGYATGAAIGLIVPSLHKRMRAKPKNRFEPKLGL
jgi:membrane-associated phospholipid phosphatase